jgi:hypothetical protein
MQNTNNRRSLETCTAVCYFKYTKNTWKFVESYIMDEDGHALTKASTHGKGRHEWQYWTNKEVDEDLCPIMGRAITFCSFTNGIQLKELNPPKWCSWLSPRFYESLTKLPDWFMLIDGGDILYHMTAVTMSKLLSWNL